MNIAFDAVSVSQAAEIIGCSTGRVRQLLRDGLIRGEKLGPRAWVVSRVDAQKMAVTPAKTGRPRSQPERHRPST